MKTKHQQQEKSPLWAMTAVVGLLCLEAVLYYNRPESHHHTHTNEDGRVTVLKEQSQEQYNFDKRIDQVEATHDINDWDSDTKFLRFEVGVSQDTRMGFYALKEGDVYLKKHTEDSSFNEVLLEGTMLQYYDEEYQIDDASVSPDLKSMLLQTHKGTEDKTCGLYWLYHVETKQAFLLTNERICKPIWSDTGAILFPRTEISPTDVYFYYPERSQMVHHHTSMNSLGDNSWTNVMV